MAPLATVFLKDFYVGVKMASSFKITRKNGNTA
jgi:hypothetical protein